MEIKKETGVAIPAKVATSRATAYDPIYAAINTLVKGESFAIPVDKTVKSHAHKLTYYMRRHGKTLTDRKFTVCPVTENKVDYVRIWCTESPVVAETPTEDTGTPAPAPEAVSTPENVDAALKEAVKLDAE